MSDIEVNQAMSDSRIEFYRFIGEDRPKAKRGERIELCLKPQIVEGFDEGRGCEEHKNFTAIVTYRENYPDGYFMICQVDGDVPRKAEVAVYHKELDSVKIYYDNTVALAKQI